MHATIKTNKSITRVLQYHELKVRKGIGECIYAENFAKDKEDLNLKDKLYHFHRLTTLNEQSKKNILHIFLNFGFGERMSNEKLATVSKEYMEGLGLGQQPYLVYRHNDTRHLHVHIVSTLICKNGERKGLSPKDYHRSKEITRQLEKQHSLSLSDPVTRKEKLLQMPLQKIKYGESPLLIAMTKVLEAVLPVYKFTSLAELNAVLHQYNMEATRGKEDSLIWKNRGLIFRPLIEKGKDESLYIKASVFPSRPTLANLEKQFVVNRSQRQAHQSRLTTAIDWALFKKSIDITALRAALQKDKITTLLQKDGSGRLKNIWYIDQQTHSVFDGAALGDRYNAAALRERCIPEERYRQEQQQLQQQRQKLQQEQQQSHRFF
jgi:hypothetical protein